jgi:hypothetical protein
MTNLPVPEQFVLSRLSEAECAELIEEHINYVDAAGRSVHLPSPFVKHFLQRADDALPTVVAISTSPIVLADGGVLAANGLDRTRGIAFLIPEELLAILPRREECTPEAVGRAMRFLRDVWLVDVAADTIGKYVVIAAGLTILERSLLPERPVFWVTAGSRGNGKTTTLTMLIVAVTGLRPAAAAWAADENERRKAILSYFMAGVSYILWDNIPRGSSITCPHIERSCTAAFYSDRKLGVSETVATAASAVHMITGNNIGPRGDLASRSLHARLKVDRADPENRAFTHSDPVAWTEDNRAQILQAMYTILLGNPQLSAPRDAPSKTRFKLWWRLIGSALEHADRVAPSFDQDGQHTALDFKQLFLDQEEDEEESATLADILTILERRWPNGMPFKAKDVMDLLNETQRVDTDPYGNRHEPTADARELREALFPKVMGGGSQLDPSTKSIGNRLTDHVDQPVWHDECTLILRRNRDTSGGAKGAWEYYVVVVEPQKAER